MVLADTIPENVVKGVESINCENLEYFETFLSSSNERWLRDHPFNPVCGKQLDDWIFRGQPFDKPLLPKALRPDCPAVGRTKLFVKIYADQHKQPTGCDNLQAGAEFDLLRDFAKAADWQGHQLIGYNMTFREEHLELKNRGKYLHKPETWPSKELWELLALAQHSGLPTRLLDWTEKVKIAAYFAARDAAGDERSNPEDKCVVWALNARIMRDNMHNIVSIIRPTMGTNICLAAQRGVLSLVRGLEEPDISKIVVKKDLFHAIIKITFPKKIAKELLERLYRENIHAGSMFPTLSGAARFAEERRLWPDNPEQ